MFLGIESEFKVNASNNVYEIKRNVRASSLGMA